MSLGAIVGFLLTLMVISYILGDNPLFRLAIHIFIGVTAGYIAVVVFYNVIWYQAVAPFIAAPLQNLSLTVPALVLCVWLLTKASPRLASVGTPVVAFLVGVGAATAIGGAVLGTIFPQVAASTNVFDSAARQPGADLLRSFLNAILVLVGTAATLAYFHFGVSSKPGMEGRRPFLMEYLGQGGMIFVAITFGVLFAGVYAAALAALVERVYFSWALIWDILGSFLSFP